MRKPMTRLSTFALIVVSTALLAGTALAVGSRPDLVAAGSRSGHVVVTYSLEGLTPGELVVARSPRVDASGRLTTGIKLQESLGGTATFGVVRRRSRGALARG